MSSRAILAAVATIAGVGIFFLVLPRDGPPACVCDAPTATPTAAPTAAATARPSSTAPAVAPPCDVYPFMSDIPHADLRVIRGTTSSTSILNEVWHTDMSELIRRQPHNSSQRSFRDIAWHFTGGRMHLLRYPEMYSRYLDLVRHRSAELSIFEIGLGCDQPVIGSGAMMWAQYMPDVRLSVLEFDGPCAEKWIAQHRDAAPRQFAIYQGDQSVTADLNRVMTLDGDRNYDMIIDDGGHSMKQQITSFLHLWPRVKHGGVYVIEDLLTAYVPIPSYGGTYFHTASAYTTTNMIKMLIDRVHAVPGQGNVHELMMNRQHEDTSVLRVDCWKFICYITKR